MNRSTQERTKFAPTNRIARKERCAESGQLPTITINSGPIAAAHSNNWLWPSAPITADVVTTIRHRIAATRASETKRCQMNARNGSTAIEAVATQRIVGVRCPELIATTVQYATSTFCATER